MTRAPIQPDRRRTIIGAMVILASCLIAYLPALRGGFIWDDDKHVTRNVALRSLDGLKNIWTTLDTEPQYYPLTHTSFWIDYHLFGLNPLGYHVENILLHAAIAFALWRFLRRLEIPVAFLAALLFALHPLQVETVAWISERKNLLSGLFEVAALLVYWPLITGDWFWGRYISAFALFLAAMLSKTVAATMPAVLLVLIWWKRGKIRPRDVSPLLPMFALSLVMSWITARLERLHVGASGADWNLSFTQRLLIASRALWFYASKIIAPMKLTFSYPRWNVRVGLSWQYLFLAVTLGLIVALIAMRKKIGRGPIAAVLIFAGVLAPALGFVNTYPMRYTFVADHFQYLAGIALITLLATLIRRREFLILIALAFAVVTINRATVYRDQISLWNDTIAKNPSSWMARNNLGVLLTENDPAKALEQFQIVEQLRPDHPVLPFNRAEAEFRLSKWNDAIMSYRKGLNGHAPQTSQTRAQTHDRIGLAFAHLKRPGDAKLEFEQAVALDPQFAEAKLHLAQTFDQLAETLPAIAEYESYLELRPDDAHTHAWLGALYLQRGNYEKSAHEFSVAVSIEPDFTIAKEGLRRALTAQRQPQFPATSQSSR